MTPYWLAFVVVLIVWARWPAIKDAYTRGDLARRGGEAAVVVAEGLVESEMRRRRMSPFWIIALTALGMFSAPKVASYVADSPAVENVVGSVWSVIGRGRVPTGVPPIVVHGPPNTPSIVALAVVDTSTVWVEGSAYSHPSGDTQDSVIVVITRLGQDTTTVLASARTATATNARDTVSDNTNLEADSTYRAWFKYHATNGGYSAYSAPDTFVNSVASGVTVHFWSDWSTATGTTSAAIYDTNKAKPWTLTAGHGEPGEGGLAVRVTATDSRDYPTTNYLRITGYWQSSGWNELKFIASDNYIPASAVGVGDTIVLRFYARFIAANSYQGNDDETHGIYFDSTGSQGWSAGGQAVGIYEQHFTNDVWNYLVVPDTDQNPHYFGPGTNALNRNTTYRFELGWVRTGTNTYQMLARIYNATGTLLYDTSAFDDNYYGPGGTSLSGRTMTKSTTNNEAGHSTMRGLKIGLNGLSGLTTDTVPFMEMAGLAICSNWCGAYPIAGVEN
ncbi:MAG: hypothetical protein AB7R40_23420 [Nitrospiraceae bacterium]